MELKSCPICGGEPEFQHFNITPNARGRIICSCGLEIRQGVNETEDDLRIIWNTRVDPYDVYEGMKPMTEENLKPLGWVRERTCKNVGYYVDSTRFECSECGFNGWTKWAADGKDKVPNYCPNCGSKVEGEER